ncbi:MAG: site-specific integrase [Sulfuritalea sp.]|jgi:integrase|nr:site-specific integrase [Sulfuritalea sp.]
MMANRISFTKAALDALPVSAVGQRATFHDTKTPGLQLRLTATGVKTFSIFRRVRGGEPERVTLGRYPAMSIEQARRLAMETSAAMEGGENPAETRRAARGERTFGNLFEVYLERHAKPSKRTWREDQQRFDQYLKKPLSGKKLSMVDRQMVSAVHSAITCAGHPVVANRVLALVSSVFGWGISAGLCDNNPVRGIKRNSETSRDRFLQSSELPRFFAALAEEQDDTIRDYLLLSLLTGARRANVQAMRWVDVALERNEWRIPMTKNGTPQTVTLTPESLEILLRRQAANDAAADKRSPFVFPGPGKAGHLMEPKKGWQRILERAEVIEITNRFTQAGRYDEAVQDLRAKAAAQPGEALQALRKHAQEAGVHTGDAGLGDLRIHDLRRTLGSWQAKTGASLAIIGKSLNHKNTATTAIYARLDLDPVRESMERATSAMLTAAGVKKPAKAVTLAKTS